MKFLGEYREKSNIKDIKIFLTLKNSYLMSI